VDGDQIVRLLAEREAAARAEWLRLEQEAAQIAALIEECRREIDRLAITQEVLSGWSPHRGSLRRQRWASTRLETSRTSCWWCSSTRPGRCGAGRWSRFWARTHP
jgi:hypothetical protein